MPPPLRKSSPGPQCQHTMRYRSNPVSLSSRSRSPSLSANDSDDDFVYLLEHVNTTEEAVERIRAMQQPKEQNQGRFLGGLRGSARSLTEPVTTSPNKHPASRKMRGKLPATMEEFYDSPRYTISLTAARKALFSDALSGFHSYVAREEAQRDQLWTLQRHCDTHHLRNREQGSAKQPTQYVHTYGPQGSIVHNSAIPSLSPRMTQEWNTALATSSACLAKPAAMRVEVTGRVDEEHGAQVGTPTSAVSSNKRAENPNASLATAGAGIPPPSAVPGSTVAEEAVTVAVAEGTGSSLQRIPASYIFLMRSRDTEAMDPVTSPAPAAAPHSVTFEDLSLPPSRDLGASSRATAASATGLHVDPAASAAAVGERAKQVPAPPSQTLDSEQAKKLEAMQLHALLQEDIYRRARTPVVFRYNYSPDFEETIEESKLRHQQLDRALCNYQRLAGARDLTRAERREISRRFADPNALDHEWLYVWEQFERDIPRETLFVEDTPYHDPNDALAAILSYVECCYDRAQKHIKEKSAATLTGEQNSGAAPTAAVAAAAAPLCGSNSSTSSTPPRETTLFEHFFSAGTAALKGAVVKMRSSLPDFVGDPLLSVSGYDPALYHASLFFPTDPKARSAKIFSAVREVVLACQQSFMGFPYQLLCEQVGTERLGLALEALERDQAEDDDLDEAEAEKTARVALVDKMHEEGEVETSGSGTSAPTPINNAEGAESTLKETSSSLHSQVHGSRVLRIYHSFPSTASVANRSGSNHHRRRQHTAHDVDEWNVSLSSSYSSDVASSSLSPVVSPTAVSPRTSAPPPVRGVGKLPAAVMNVTPAHCLSEEERRRKENVTRRRRERRRRRREQLPLLVGEPRPHEFAAFLDIVRSCVIAKQAKDEKNAMEQQQRQRVENMLKRQCEQRNSTPASRQGSRQGPHQISSAPLNTVQQTGEDSLPPTTNQSAKCASAEVAAATAQPAGAALAPRKLFREDVEGSAYLIPTRSTSAAVEPLLCSPLLPLSSTSTRKVAASPETRGMRILLFFDDKRNAPVVVVNKLFRLFIMPGLCSLTSSEDDTTEVLNNEMTVKAGTAHPNPPAHKSGAGRTGNSEKNLLLLIQVQFSLFLEEDAEVRWKWWKL
ncbi:hypothetical protein LPMP_200680 [Leishmania panamensis]|uniref:Uncharacterized protein n=1 Tax=Leishmania panamensis TaxID=5679 RepID=A0A088RP07_LEIPA|nr:hypothetical protein LPMP_200680 [Leishmania panamensis]AIN97560.1 hypothetical protein LPMP_200680 [Leishmania panamensis]